jgi:hypothetical protein
MRKTEAVMTCFLRPMLGSLALACFLLSATPAVRAQASLTPAQVEENLADFFHNEMNLRRSAVHVEGGKVLLALDVKGLDAETIVGATGLMLSTAGGAAPWSSEVRLSVYENKALVYQVAVDTSAVTDLLSGRITGQQFVASWRFDSAPGTGQPGGGQTAGGQTAGGQTAGGQTGGSQTAGGQTGGGQTGSGTGAGTGTSTALTLEPSADTHVYAYSYQNWNASNWGKYEVLGAGWHPVGGEKRTFLKFDLAGIDLRNVVSAKLRLYRYHLAGNGAKPLGVYRITSPWQEGRGTYKPASAALPGEITWLNQPGFDPRTPQSFSSVGAQPVFIEVDITWLAEAWASGFENHGILLRPHGNPDSSSPEAMFGFYAREHADAGKRPKLVLEMAGGTATGGGATPQPGGGMTWDFETGDLRGWTRTGTAFDYQPTLDDNPTARRRGQASAHGGRYWIGGYEKYQGKPGEKPGAIQGDGPTGTLTSQAFTIPGGQLEFLVGGGASAQTRVELLVDGQPVLQVSGRNHETMQLVSWDLTPWTGRSGRIRLVDNSSSGWGHINADEFRFTSGAPIQQAGTNTGSGIPGTQQTTGPATTGPVTTGPVTTGPVTTGPATGDWSQGNSGGNANAGSAGLPSNVPQVTGQGGIVTDGAWKVTAEAPVSPAWMYPGFDDSAWPNSAADWRLQPAPATRIAGMADTAASWIWHPDDPDLVHFRREIDLADMPREAALRITADNDYMVHVNGAFVGQDAGNQISVWNTAETYDITPFLKPGRNVIAVIARDLGGGSGLLMDVRFGGPATVPGAATGVPADPVSPPSGQQGQWVSTDATPQDADTLVQQGKAAQAQAYGATSPAQRQQAFAKALAFFQQAQSMGSAEAIYLIGFMYETGNGVPFDNDIAAAHYEEAARAGYADAYRQLILVQNQFRRHPAAAATFFRYYKAFPRGALQGVDDHAYSPEVLRAIQKELRRAGYYNGAIDGIIGRGTRGAIERYVNEQLPDEIITPGAQPVSGAQTGTWEQTGTGGQTASGGQTDPVELAFWETIQNSQNPADFQAYLNRWPNGVFAPLVRNRLGDAGSTATPGTPAAPGGTFQAPRPSAGYHEPRRGTAERRAIMDAARQPISRELGQSVIFVVDVVRTDGHWAYLQAVPHQPGGAPINWDRTRFGRDIRDGMMSDIAMVLLRNRDGRWQVEDHVFGPTDVYWYEWVDRYSLPETLFFPG